MEFAEQSTWRVSNFFLHFLCLIHLLSPFPKGQLLCRLNFIFFFYLLYAKIGASDFSNPFWLVFIPISRYLATDKIQVDRQEENKEMARDHSQASHIQQSCRIHRIPGSAMVKIRELMNSTLGCPLSIIPSHWFGTWRVNVLILSRWFLYLINVFEIEIKGSSNYQEIPTLVPFCAPQLWLRASLTKKTKRTPQSFPVMSASYSYLKYTDFLLVHDQDLVSNCFTKYVLGAGHRRHKKARVLNPITFFEARKLF